MIAAVRITHFFILPLHIDLRYPRLNVWLVLTTLLSLEQGRILALGFLPDYSYQISKGLWLPNCHIRQYLAVDGNSSLV